MADEVDPTEEEISFTPAEAGFAFKAEMWAANTLMGYWKHITAVVVVSLLTVLFYGQWLTYVQRTQRGAAAQIADVEKDLPTSLVQLSALVKVGSPEASPENLEEVAARLEAIAASESGTAATEAALKSAELYRLAGATEKQRKVLEMASADAGAGPLYYAAEAALANLELEEGEGDAAVKRLRTLMNGSEGYLAEQAAIDLGLVLEHLERTDEAGKIYTDFLAKWPESPRADKVKERQGRLSGSAG